MISLGMWLRIRNRLDRYFRKKALRPGRIRVSGERSLSVDPEDVSASESAKRARRAAYFLIRQGGRQSVHSGDVEVMRRSYDDISTRTYIGHVSRSFEGRMSLELDPGVCEALHWQEGDRIGLRRLYSGELLTFLDRQARR